MQRIVFTNPQQRATAAVPPIKGCTMKRVTPNWVMSYDRWKFLEEVSPWEAGESQHHGKRASGSMSC